MTWRDSLVLELTHWIFGDGRPHFNLAFLWLDLPRTTPHSTPQLSHSGVTGGKADAGQQISSWRQDGESSRRFYPCSSHHPARYIALPLFNATPQPVQLSQLDALDHATSSPEIDDRAFQAALSSYLYHFISSAFYRPHTPTETPI